MRQCVNCKEEFDDSWGVCLYCSKPLVVCTEKALDMPFQKYKPRVAPSYKQDKATETAVNILLALWQVIKFVLIGLLCIIAVILGIWIVVGIFNLLFGDNN
jgi:hypothetical protein